MKRWPFLSSLVAVAIGWAAPGCSGDEFTATSGGGDAADGGEPSGGNSGTSGSDSGGQPNGGSSGSSTGGASTGGDAGEPSGGDGNGGMSGTAGIPSGGRGGGGVSGMAGRAGSGGTMGGASGSGGSVGGGSGGKGGSAGKGGTGGAAGTAGTGGAMQAGCPPTSPALGSNCNTSNYCMYGSHPLVTCRQILDCVAGHWQERQPSCGTPPSCSVSSEPPIVGESCLNDGFQCLADQDVFCMCASDCTISTCTLPVWHCFGPPPNCPPLLPNHGQPCSSAMSCTYGTCSSGTSTVASCENGAWRLREGNCPQ